MLHRIGAQDDPQTFLDLLQDMTEECQQPTEEWSLWLLLLLLREDQMAALSLAPALRRSFPVACKAILDHLSLENPRQFSKTARWQQRIALHICPATPGCSSKLVAAWAFEGLGVAAGDSGLQKICSVPSWRDCTVGLLPSTSEPTHMYIKISNNENTIIVGHNPSKNK